MSDEVVQTPFGKFYVDSQDLIGSTLKAGTCWDGPGFLQVLGRQYAGFGHTGRTVLDIGANQGAWTVWLASCGMWRVVAVEPVPETFNRLRANLDLNRAMTAERVIPLQVVAGAGHARASLSLWDPTNTGGATFIEDPQGPYEVRPLDEYQFLFGDQVSLIKIDVQGWELATLEGLHDTIRTHRPAIVVERETGSLNDCLPYLPTGYRGYPWPNRAHDFLFLPS